MSSARSDTKHEKRSSWRGWKTWFLWHFGMDDHIGIDARTGLTHSLETTAANEHDLNQATGYCMAKSSSFLRMLAMFFALANIVRVGQMIRT